MRKILFTALLALSFISSCRAQTVFTFECFCGYLTVADGNCDVCGPTLQSRMFTGIIIRRNGVPHKWIETPYTVRFNGQVARFQELVYPNPETINIDRSQTPYSTLDSFKMAIQCPCVGGGGRDTIVIDSSGAVCAALYFFANDTAAIASATTDQYDYYLTAPENYYGLPAGLVKLAWETTLPDSANAPGCGSGGGGGTGTVTSFSFTDGGGFTGTVLNPTTTPTLSLVLQDAAADGATKGKATFTAADFNSAAGVISLDYVNGQKANGSQPGFLSSTDWTTFNGKLTANAPITGATKTKITYDANGLVTAGADATTSDIAEGSNLYYTDERNDDRTAALIQNNTGISWSYNDGAGTLTPTITDNSVTNEGALSVTAGLSNTSQIQSNTSGDAPIVLKAGTNVTLSESGDTITIAASGGGGADNLGNHTATQDLNMANKNIFAIDTAKFKPTAGRNVFISNSTGGGFQMRNADALTPANYSAIQLLNSGLSAVYTETGGTTSQFEMSSSAISMGMNDYSGSGSNCAFGANYSSAFVRFEGTEGLGVISSEPNSIQIKRQQPIGDFDLLGTDDSGSGVSISTARSGISAKFEVLTNRFKCVGENAVFYPPVLEAGQISALTSVETGAQIHNYTTNLPQYYDGVQWRNTARPYKVYAGLMSASGGTISIDVVMENTTGANFTWTDTGGGMFEITGDVGGVFGSGKTLVFFTPGSGATPTHSSFEQIGPETFRMTNTTADGSSAWSTFSGMSFEFRIYP